MNALMMPYPNVPPRSAASHEDLPIRRLLTLTWLRDELKEVTDMVAESLTLIAQICEYSEELLDQPADEDEWRSQLRYRIANPISGELELACEWVRLFEIRPEYLSLAPPNVAQGFRLAEIAKRSHRNEAPQPSLAGLIKKRTEDDKKMWNLAITERNAHCDWPLHTNIAALEVFEPSGDTTGIAPLYTHTMIQPSRDQSPMFVTSKKRKRAVTGREIPRNDGHSARPQKRSSHMGTANATSQATPFAQVYPQQASVYQSYVGQNSAPVADSSPRWPYPMPTGQRRGLRPKGGTNTFPYEWSQGRKRAWLEIAPSNGGLPNEALEDHWNNFTSCCTSEHADVRRLGNLHVSVIELLSVRSWVISFGQPDGI
jgi:hypothetical protein